MAMLEVKDLSVYYGVIQALKGISFEVEEGDVIALIGANGAGKTTTLHTITGLIPAKSGSIVFEGKNITKLPGYKLVPMGIAHVPEGRRVFAKLSVLQNLKMGAYTRKDKQEIEDTIRKIYMRFPRLEERKNQLAGTLSGGEQQMLAMGRALMSHPRLIVMDEPSMGLSPIFVNEIFDIIKEVSGAYPGKRIYAMIGGFHLYHTSEEGVRALAGRIRSTGIEKIYTGHCTGAAAYEILKEELGEQAEGLYTGMEIVI